MKLFTLFAVILVSLNIKAQSVIEGAKATVKNGKPVVEWKVSPKFIYSVERYTNDSEPELVATDLKSGQFVDQTALMNVQYYYRVNAISEELKLDVATKLLHETDFSPGTGKEFKGTNDSRENGSITFRPTAKLQSFSKLTGIQFSPAKRYSVNFHFGPITGTGFVNLSVGGITCGNYNNEIKYLAQYSEKVFSCNVDTTVALPKEKFHTDAFVVYIGSGNYTVTINKVEIFEY